MSSQMGPIAVLHHPKAGTGLGACHRRSVCGKGGWNKTTPPFNLKRAAVPGRGYC